jgi:hypothetical protein
MKLAPTLSFVLLSSWFTACTPEDSPGITPFGYGLKYGAHVQVGHLDETPGPAAGCSN